MVEYRPLPEDQDDVFYEYVRYAFRPEQGPVVGEADPTFMALGDRRGLYPDGAAADDDPLCVCIHHWLDATVRGDRHATPALVAVASPPERRHGGNVRELLRASLAEYREREARFTVLWPFEYAYYRKYGWDTANKRTVYTCDPEALAFARDAREGVDFRQLAPDEYEALVPVYEADASEFELWIDRPAAWWGRHVFADYAGMRFVYAASVDGEDRGYLAYRITDGADGRTMDVLERAALDRPTSRALLGFCHGHASQVETVRLHAPEESCLLDRVPEPEAVTCEVETGPMVRIVDVADTLSALSYPEVDERLVLAVTDPLVDWNDGAFALDVADGSGVCEAVDDAPDVTIDVAALAQLAVGYRSAADLAAAGRIEGTGGAVEALDRAFPERRVFLRERF